MKREIKFRAYRKSTQNTCDVLSIDFENESVLLSDGDEEDISDVDLMQYTGLHDKNGREVYEGDVVKLHQVVLSPDDTIGWVEYTAQYGYSIRFGKRRCRQSDWATDEGAKYEVIGNIFENPELLEAQHD
ncbi:YopX family protein [Schleiferilactobacillus harbinensis]|uniref:YopX family protein n=1 Tax=Schleiferilactobacillus harbinensis TaxID=304207 RepID=A0ABU7T381_9LACO